ATPSGSSKNLYGESGLYQAHKGDFEFLVMKATPEEVILKGKRSENIMYMYPLSEDPGTFARKASEIVEQVFVASYSGTVGDAPATAYLDLSNRWISLELTGGDAEVESPFLFDDAGILFYKPIKVGTYTIERLNWVNSTKTLVSPDGAAVSVSLKGELPAGWRSYEDLLGDYDLIYNDSGQDFWSSPRHAKVTLVQDEYKKTMLMKGVNDLYDLKINYDLSSGNMLLMGQIVGTWEANGNSIYFAPLFARDSGKGGATWSGWRSSNYGMRIVVDDEASEEAGTIVAKFTTGPCPSAAQPITGFGLLAQTPSGASGGYMSSSVYSAWFPFNFRYYAIFWVSMTKE
ncbi:MAG: DUF4302 domain-containing protein, partial [Bacteroidales bacterium]|nr:DUF4302 domain-containing protein [Bacteroidales bacterium]